MNGSTLTEADGRGLNSLNQAYILPSDPEEHPRLDIQHNTLREYMSSLYWPTELIERVLAPRGKDEPVPGVLDIGCGSGRWLIEMGRQFAHVNCVGLDLAPVEFTDSGWYPPSNCTFVVDDANKPLLHYNNCFDVIHVHADSSAIKDFRTLLYDLQHILRPGGVLLVVNRDPLMYGEDEQPLLPRNEGEPGFSWLVKFIHTAQEATATRRKTLLHGSDSVRDSGDDASRGSQSWMESMVGWQAQGRQHFLVPVGPWKPNVPDNERHAAQLLQEDVQQACFSLRSALLQCGYPADEVDRWIEKTQEEITTMRVHTYVGWTASWAQKAQKTLARA